MIELVARITRAAVVGLLAVASPAPVVVPGAFEKMGKEKTLEFDAGFQRVILFPADTAVGQLLVAFRASKTRNRRKRAAVGTAHDELQVAVAYLCHGGFLLRSVYLCSASDSNVRIELSSCSLYRFGYT